MAYLPFHKIKKTLVYVSSLVNLSSKVFTIFHKTYNFRNLFVHHVKSISNIVQSLTPNATVLIWDDMLRGIRPDKWKNIEKLYNIQPVCWDYEPTIQVSHTNLFKYHQMFQHLWIASAFKGADGRIATFPSTRNRFLNLLHWLNFIQGYRFGGERNIHNFKGIILTGWSRYSHMDPPCELLPVAFPSLIINLLLIREYHSGNISTKWTTKYSDVFYGFVDEVLSNSVLKCETIENIFNEGNCDFDGKDLYIALANFSALVSKLSANTIFDNKEMGLECVEYYSKIGFLNTNKVQDFKLSVDSNLKELTKLESFVTKEMSKYYDRDFVTEYVNYKSQFIRNRLQNILPSLNRYVDLRKWPRRSKNCSFFV